jgi:hypothetical protein
MSQDGTVIHFANRLSWPDHKVLKSNRSNTKQLGLDTTKETYQLPGSTIQSNEPTRMQRIQVNDSYLTIVNATKT